MNEYAPWPKRERKCQWDYVLLAIILFALFIIVLLSGCARFHTVQEDISYDTTQKPSRTITTEVSAWTFFSASSDLAKFRASQTDKTQSASVGSLSQDSSETNFIHALGAGLGTALKVYTGGLP